MAASSTKSRFSSPGLALGRQHRGGQVGPPIDLDRLGGLLVAGHDDGGGGHGHDRGRFWAALS